jgi:hypothetical protein
VFERLAAAKKTVVAVLGFAAVLGPVLATQDVSTVQGIVAAVVAAVASYGVWKAKNKPVA